MGNRTPDLECTLELDHQEVYCCRMHLPCYSVCFILFLNFLQIFSAFRKN